MVLPQQKALVVAGSFPAVSAVRRADIDNRLKSLKTCLKLSFALVVLAVTGITPFGWWAVLRCLF